MSYEITIKGHNDKSLKTADIDIKGIEPYQDGTDAKLHYENRFSPVFSYEGNHLCSMTYKDEYEESFFCDFENFLPEVRFSLHEPIIGKGPSESRFSNLVIVYKNNVRVIGTNISQNAGPLVGICPKIHKNDYTNFSRIRGCKTTGIFDCRRDSPNEFIKDISIDALPIVQLSAIDKNDLDVIAKSNTVEKGEVIVRVKNGKCKSIEFPCLSRISPYKPSPIIEVSNTMSDHGDHYTYIVKKNKDIGQVINHIKIGQITNFNTELPYKFVSSCGDSNIVDGWTKVLNIALPSIDNVIKKALESDGDGIMVYTILLTQSDHNDRTFYLVQFNSDIYGEALFNSNGTLMKLEYEVADNSHKTIEYYTRDISDRRPSYLFTVDRTVDKMVYTYSNGDYIRVNCTIKYTKPDHSEYDYEFKIDRNNAGVGALSSMISTMKLIAKTGIDEYFDAIAVMIGNEKPGSVAQPIMMYRYFDLLNRMCKDPEMFSFELQDTETLSFGFGCYPINDINLLIYPDNIFKWAKSWLTEMNRGKAEQFLLNNICWESFYMNAIDEDGTVKAPSWYEEKEETEDESDDNIYELREDDSEEEIDYKEEDINE